MDADAAALSALAESPVQLSAQPEGVCALLPDWSAVVHQANCVSFGAAGLAAELFRRVPPADVYRRRAGPRARPDHPGSLDFTPGRPEVVALFAQVYPGRAGAGGDSPEDRLRFFQSGLEGILAEARRRGGGAFAGGVVFPWRIGCGLAGGDWARYAGLVAGFARRAPFPVLVVGRPGDLPEGAAPRPRSPAHN